MNTTLIPNDFWYTRRDGVVRGPFPAKRVSDSLLLGRLRESDEVSRDGQAWQKLSEVSRLIPEAMRHVETDEDRRRLEIERRRVDERMCERRGGKVVPAEIIEKRRRERRGRESPDAFPASAPENERHPLLRPAYWVPMLLVVFIGLGMLASLILHGPAGGQENPGNCGALPQPGVNWNHCLMPKANLVSADLTGAILHNARLHGADLRRASLSDADLNYADLDKARLDRADLRQVSLRGALLRGAVLEGADLTGADLRNADLRNAVLRGARLDQARLGRAIWTDGRVCAPGSVGACNPAARRP